MSETRLIMSKYGFKESMRESKHINTILYRIDTKCTNFFVIIDIILYLSLGTCTTAAARLPSDCLTSVSSS